MYVEIEFQVCEWSMIDEVNRRFATIADFKRKLLTCIGPVTKLSLKCLISLVQNKRQISDFNLVLEHKIIEHKFQHNVHCLNPICFCNTGIEDNAHFFLHSPLHVPMRSGLLGRLPCLPTCNDKQMILETFIDFIKLV